MPAAPGWVLKKHDTAELRCRLGVGHPVWWHSIMAPNQDRPEGVRSTLPSPRDRATAEADCPFFLGQTGPRRIRHSRIASRPESGRALHAAFHNHIAAEARPIAPDDVGKPAPGIRRHRWAEASRP